MNVPSPVWIYRMTHLANLPHILQHGLATRHAPEADPNFVAIGKGKLILERDERTVPLPPYGSFSEYVPFYFGHRSPMLYQISTGWEGVTKTSQNDIVYIVSSLEQLRQHNCQYVFTDGHAASRLTRFFTDVADLNLIDWDTVNSTDWRNTEDDPDRQRRKQAEVLVHGQVPTQAFQFLLTHTDEKAQIVTDLVHQAELTIPVRVSKKAYYDNL